MNILIYYLREKSAMNYLAHLVLSGKDEDLLIGNYIADGIKGEDKSNYKPRVLEGIALHRKIDYFTDKHPIFKQSAKRLQKKYGLYSWVIVDVFYDHFLATEWKNYHNESLDNYAQNIYRILDDRLDELPFNSKRFLGYMKQYNILVKYGELTGIERVLIGLSNRTRFDSKMEFAINDLKNDYTLYKDEFTAFFPILTDFVKQQEEIRL